MAYIASIRINQVISSDLVPGTDVEWLRFEQSHLHHSAIRRASQQFLTAFYQEFGELAQTSPSGLRWSIPFGSLAVRWPSLPSPGRMCWRLGNLRRTYTGASYSGDSPRPPPQ